jgi:Flp pilus assembly protein TadB
VIGVGITLIVAGVILLFYSPWAAAPVGAVGLALVMLWFAGFGRRRSRVSETGAK